MSTVSRGVALIAVAIALAILGMRRRVAPSFRWLPGLAARTVSTERSADAVDRLAPMAEDRVRCPVVDAQEVTADLAPAPGDERVLASISTGVVILDADGRRIASAPLGPCGGSADAIVALAVGDAWIGAPVIAVVSSTGGHRESETTLGIYLLDGRALVPLFSEPLELRDSQDLWTGAATLVPGAIVYRAPTGETSVTVLRRATPTS